MLTITQCWLLRIRVIFCNYVTSKSIAISNRLSEKREIFYGSTLQTIDPCSVNWCTGLLACRRLRSRMYLSFLCDGIVTVSEKFCVVFFASQRGRQCATIRMSSKLEGFWAPFFLAVSIWRQKRCCCVTWCRVKNVNQPSSVIFVRNSNPKSNWYIFYFTIPIHDGTCIIRCFAIVSSLETWQSLRGSDSTGKDGMIQMVWIWD